MPPPPLRHVLIPWLLRAGTIIIYVPVAVHVTFLLKKFSKIAQVAFKPKS